VRLIGRTARYSWGLETTKPTVELSALGEYGGGRGTKNEMSLPMITQCHLLPFTSLLRRCNKRQALVSESSPRSL